MELLGGELGTVANLHDVGVRLGGKVEEAIVDTRHSALSGQITTIARTSTETSNGTITISSGDSSTEEDTETDQTRGGSLRLVGGWGRAGDSFDCAAGRRARRIAVGHNVGRGEPRALARDTRPATTMLEGIRVERVSGVNAVVTTAEESTTINGGGSGGGGQTLR